MSGPCRIRSATSSSSDNPTITFCTAIAGLLPACSHHAGTVLANLQGQQESREDGQLRALRTETGEPVQGEVGNNLPTPDEDDDEETQGTDWGQDGEASHAAGEVGGREAEDFKSRQGDKGPDAFWGKWYR